MLRRAVEGFRKFEGVYIGTTVPKFQSFKPFNDYDWPEPNFMFMELANIEVCHVGNEPAC